ncbi:Zinc-type alcohol dehydrogenase-like protein [Fusarium oxysporum f. sp. cubense]|uniref:Zinc-type alcohol dehydrogenase-like protein n=1 Tax=Fusarium oxysporum f. sp. cubense TaxID=61366 RepID=A0A559L9C1_FUSOC|nr:Zinc-type alcohol dehydrogenase-like protein [Fusarium oxysporum f. sp. cubense]
MQAEGSRKLRQGHRKSRNGCTTCKKRHIKCDEKRPECANCSISERTCHYAPPQKRKTGSSPYETELTTLSAFPAASVFADLPVPSPPDLHEIESDDLFTFGHLNLLYHVQEHMADWMMVTDRLQPLANGYITTALKTPYLMNQLLALSAMHLKTIDKHTAQSYMNTATHLRHRALRGFNKCLDDTSESNSTAQFFFASLLALHYLAETVAGLADQDFATTLDCMVNYFRLHRGARVMGERASTGFTNSRISQWLMDASKEGSHDSHATSAECAVLASMLETSELNEESRKACEEATEALGFVVRRIQGPNSWGVHGLMAWSNLIPWRFLTLLEKQIPEALVILAHYAVLLHRFRKKGFDSLQLRAVPKESPQLGQILVRIKAVSLNWRDGIVAIGTYPFPGPDALVPGSDGAGIVEAVGEGVTEWKEGDRVVANFTQEHIAGRLTRDVGLTQLGGEAQGLLGEYFIFPKTGVVKIPDYLSFEEASCLPCAALTAWNALFGLTPLRPGQTVLLQGTGGVSTFALQIAHAAGAKTIVTSSSDDKLAKAEDLGATYGINYNKTPDWAAEAMKITKGKGVDHIIEIGGTLTLQASFDAIGFNGQIHCIGHITNPDPLGAGKDLRGPDAAFLALDRLCVVRGVVVGSREQLQDMLECFETNEIRPVIDRVFSFEKAREAYDHLWSSTHTGKVVIQVP